MVVAGSEVKVFKNQTKKQQHIYYIEQKPTKIIY